MTYEQTVTYLYETIPAFHKVGATAYHPGVENMKALLDAVGKEQGTLSKVVHIAGTNGKGSNSHLIAAALQAAGNRVGLYTSPHLVDLRERIRVNGQMISKEQVVAFVERNKALIERLSPSFFELMTALAFTYFTQEKVDVAVVEVGLGGRLDCTNVLGAEQVLLSVITNIGLDHTEFLGTTLPEIAAEKAGIIKPGVPCVIGETDERTAPVFIEKAKACGIWGEGLETTDCRIWFADQCGYLRRCRENQAPNCELKGLYQQKNQQTAYVALRTLQALYPDLHLSKEAIRLGYAKVCTLTGLRGRWETLSEQPLTICDTGHNGHGFQYVARQLAQMGQKYSLHIVLGMVDDKDIDTVLGLLHNHCPSAHYYFTQAKTHRAVPAEALRQRFVALAAQTTHTQAFSSVEEALKQAQTKADKEGMVFIGGSNYVVGEALALLEPPTNGECN